MPEYDAPVLAFPCEFPIKIMGKTQAGFAQAVIEVVRRHALDFDPATLEMRPSREGKYLSLTCTIRAVSRESVNFGGGRFPYLAAGGITISSKV